MTDRLSPPPAYRSAVAGIRWPAIVPSAGASLLALLFQFEHSQWLDAPAIRRRQFDQLRDLCEFLWPVSEFYRQRLQLAGWHPGQAIDATVWSRLEPLNRRTVQDQRDAMCAHASPPAHGRLLEFSTNGSQGTPVRVLGNELTHLLASALTVRNHFWHRRDFSGRFASIRTKAGSHRLPNWGLIESAAFETGPSAILDIATPLDGQIDWLTQESPNYLLSHPSNLRALLLRAQERGIRFPSLREIASYGEMLPADLRTLVRETLGLRLVDLYSSEELGTIALQCPGDERSYHVQAENLLVEVVDEAGHPCAPGQLGRVLVTHLHNFTMPLLRYEIGDYAVPGGECACGRGLPTLSGIAGRRRNMMSLRNGGLRWPTFPPWKLKEIADYRQIQMEQTSLDDLIVRLAGISPLQPSIERQFGDRLCELLGQRFNVAFEYPSAILPTAGGKYEDFQNRLLS